MKKTVETPYGQVDAKALERLRNRFDTRRLLDAADRIDRIRSRISEADGLRQDLLDLHLMAHRIVNGDVNSRTSRSEAIWELAGELAGEVIEFGDALEAIQETLTELEELASEDGGED